MMMLSLGFVCTDDGVRCIETEVMMKSLGSFF